MNNSLITQLKEALLDYEEDRVRELAEEIARQGLQVHEAIGEMVALVRDLGVQFDRTEIFLPELIIAAETMKVGLAVLEKQLVDQGDRIPSQGTVVLGTVRGDLHDIGKTLVATMLSVGGFTVHDLGTDVRPERFLEEAERVEADIIGTSTLITTGHPAQRELIELLIAAGKREKYYLIIGGGAVTGAWARDIGADGFSVSAGGAVELCRTLLSTGLPAPLAKPVIC